MRRITGIQVVARVGLLFGSPGFEIDGNLWMSLFIPDTDETFLEWALETANRSNVNLHE
jgi:hypothetical protein